MYARRKGIDLRDIDVRNEHGKRENTYVMNRRIHYIGNLSAEEQERLTEIANKCLVHKT
jgi:putative redox protein